MAAGLQKQILTVNFSAGMNTKVDPFQRNVSQFALLQNVVFDKDGMLTKRNGFAPLAALGTDYSYLPVSRVWWLMGISVTAKPSMRNSVGMKRCIPLKNFNLAAHSRLKMR